MSSWMNFTVFHTLRPIVATLLAVVIVATPLPQILSGRSVAEAAPDQTPPGQLTRKSISGIVVSAGGSSITISTNFGNILVNVTSDTFVNAPPEKDVGMSAVAPGAKVIVKLNRSLLTKPGKGKDGDNGTSTGDGTNGGNGTSTGDGTNGTNGGNGTSTGDGTNGINGGNGTSTGDGTNGTNGGNGTSTGDGITSTRAFISDTFLIQDMQVASIVVVGSAGFGTLSFRGMVIQESSTDDGLNGDNGTSTGDGTNGINGDNGTSTGDGTPPSGDTSGLPPFRTVTATVIIVVKADAAGKIKATRSHKRDIVNCTTDASEPGDGSGDGSSSDGGNGTTSSAVFSPVSGDGTEFLAALAPVGAFGLGSFVFRGAFLQESSTDDGTGGTNGVNGTSTDDGTGEADCILLTRQKGGDPEAREIRAALRSARIAERLDRIIDRLESQGKTEQIQRILDRVQERETRAADREQEKLDREQARADKQSGGGGQGGGGGGNKGGGNQGGGQGQGGGGGGNQGGGQGKDKGNDD